MEYGVFKIPQPDYVFYLNLPLDVVLKLIKKRDKNNKRNYLHSQKDVHEKDINFLKNSRKSALWLAKTQGGWIQINCEKNGTIDTRENIHEKIYAKVKKVLKK